MSRYFFPPSRFARLLATLGMVATGLSASSGLAQPRENVVTFDIPVLPESQRYLEILTVPGYAVLVLENNDLYPSLSSRVIVKSRDRFQMQAGSLQYKGRNGTLYLYEAGFNVPLAVGET